MNSIEIRCTSVVGVGAYHRWFVTVRGFESDPSEHTTSYAPPTLSAFIGEGALDALTMGQQIVSTEKVEVVEL